MDTISHTNVHYIRCIKPNERKAAWEWDAPQVLGQLRACGVLETIRISCAGYPSRWAFEDFAERCAEKNGTCLQAPGLTQLLARRYYMLIDSNDWQGDLKDVCSLILDKTITEEDKYQVGLTKLFFRAGMLAYLEGLRADRLNYLVVLVQKNLRRHLARNHYRSMKSASVTIQSRWRGVLGRRKADGMRKVTAVVKIQTLVRGFVQRKRFELTRQSAVKIQSGASPPPVRVRASGPRRLISLSHRVCGKPHPLLAMRGFRARQTYKELRLQTSATTLQRLWRGLYVL